MRVGEISDDVRTINNAGETTGSASSSAPACRKLNGPVGLCCDCWLAPVPETGKLIDERVVGAEGARRLLLLPVLPLLLLAALIAVGAGPWPLDGVDAEVV